MNETLDSLIKLSPVELGLVENLSASEKVAVKLARILTAKKPLSFLRYTIPDPNSGALNSWPEHRNPSQSAAQYQILTPKNHVSVDSNLEGSLQPVNESSSADQQGNPHSLTWPIGRIPQEVLMNIASYLNRDDVICLASACKEFDHNLSHTLFRSVVVPFTTDIYGTEHDQNASKDPFSRVGHHITHLGMTMEVSEDALACVPKKVKSETASSHWGTYEWPVKDSLYGFLQDKALQRLEKLAEDTGRLRQAFSKLSKVKELALSIDSGMGWLSGPDKSTRARINQKPPTVFGVQANVPDRRTQAQNEIWAHIQECSKKVTTARRTSYLRMEKYLPLNVVEALSSPAKNQPKMAFLDQHLIHWAQPYIIPQGPTPYYNSHGPPSKHMSPATFPPPCPSSSGALMISAVSTNSPEDNIALEPPLKPSELTTDQEEFLYEMERIQYAFLQSYTIAVMDNTAIFRNLQALSIPRLSDGLLPSLHRKDFWDALPALRDVSLHVIPAWRTVHLNTACEVHTEFVDQSQGFADFQNLLSRMISPRPNIKKLTIGWVTGGEHAEGAHSRNRLLLPAPITTPESVFPDAGSIPGHVLQFPHVEELAFRNCWMRPGLLVYFASQHDHHNLKYLMLDSVSITVPFRDGLPYDNTSLPALAPPTAAMETQSANVVPQAPQAAGNITANQHIVSLVQAARAAIQTQGRIVCFGRVHRQLNLAMKEVRSLYVTEIQSSLPDPVQLSFLHHQLNHIQVLNVAMSESRFVIGYQLPDPPSPETLLKYRPRIGSWIHVLDKISPGINLSDYESEFSHALPTRTTKLERIEFRSCGYARLPLLPLEPNQPRPRRTDWSLRKHRLNSVMPKSDASGMLAEIVQNVDATELAALNVGWGLTTFWADEEAAEAVEDDELLPGGTGRFSGVVEKK